jgi:hypothetical protein
VSAIILSVVVGIAIVALLFRVASKTGKNERVWEKLDDAETPSLKRGPGLARSPAKKTFNEPGAPPTVAGKPESETGLNQKHPQTAWEDSSYCWVVVCKNHLVHRRHNLFHVHRIPLGQTDAVTPRPKIDGPFFVRCDDCGKEYPYNPSAVLRYEQDLPESFTPHPLFAEEV